MLSRRRIGATTPRSCAKRRYDLDEAEIKPYFQLDKMIEAAFETARRLFGLSFKPVTAPLYHPGCARLGCDRCARPSRRVVHRRLFRAQFQAQRRLDDVAARSGETFGRHPADRPQRLQLLQARGGRTCAALLRRRAHAVPRIRPRAARNVVERDISVARGNRSAERFRRIALAALRALAGSAGDTAAIRASCRTGQPMPQALLDRLLATRTFNQGFATVEYTACALVDLDLHSLPDAGGARRDEIRAQGSRAHCHAGGDRDASPPAAFPASCFPAAAMRPATTPTCGRKCSMPTPSRLSRRPAMPSIRRRRNGCATMSTAREICAIPVKPMKRSVAACRRWMHC